MGIAISRSLLDRLIAEAAAAPEREVCGLLLGDRMRIAAARSALNVSSSPTNRFELDPRTLFETIRAERSGGPTVIGCYHSHPLGRPDPSPRDARDAAPDGRLWLIIGGGEALLWRAVENGQVHGRFERVALDVLTP